MIPYLDGAVPVLGRVARYMTISRADISSSRLPRSRLAAQSSPRSDSSTAFRPSATISPVTPAFAFRFYRVLGVPQFGRRFRIDYRLEHTASDSRPKRTASHPPVSSSRTIARARPSRRESIAYSSRRIEWAPARRGVRRHARVPRYRMCTAIVPSRAPGLAGTV